MKNLSKYGLSNSDSLLCLLLFLVFCRFFFLLCWWSLSFRCSILCLSLLSLFQVLEQFFFLNELVLIFVDVIECFPHHWLPRFSYSKFILAPLHDVLLGLAYTQFAVLTRVIHLKGFLNFSPEDILSKSDSASFPQLIIRKTFWLLVLDRLAFLHTSSSHRLHIVFLLSIFLLLLIFRYRPFSFLLFQYRKAMLFGIFRAHATHVRQKLNIKIITILWNT